MSSVSIVSALYIWNYKVIFDLFLFLFSIFSKWPRTQYFYSRIFIASLLNQFFQLITAKVAIITWIFIMWTLLKSLNVYQCYYNKSKLTRPVFRFPKAYKRPIQKRSYLTSLSHFCSIQAYLSNAPQKYIVSLLISVIYCYCYKRPCLSPIQILPLCIS